MSHEFSTCAFCPRLCRHVCPVAVATGREAAVPTALMTLPMLADQGLVTPADALLGTSLCLGCGACTAHCKLHAPVPELISAWRREAEGAFLPTPEPLAPIDGDAEIVAVLSGAADWRAAWIARTGTPLAGLRTQDELGHAAWKAGDGGVIGAVQAHLQGRKILTSSGAVQEIAAAAGIACERLPMDHVQFRSCFSARESLHTRWPDQLACCGRREGFAAREPEAAGQVARRNGELLAERCAEGEIGCDDQGCADWLRRNGVRARGPVDMFMG